MHPRYNQSHPTMGSLGPPSIQAVAQVRLMTCSLDPKLHPHPLAPTGPTSTTLPTNNSLNRPRLNFNSRPRPHPRASLSPPRCSPQVLPLPGPPLPGTPTLRWLVPLDPQQGAPPPLDKTGVGHHQSMSLSARPQSLILTQNPQIPQGLLSPS